MLGAVAWGRAPTPARRPSALLRPFGTSFIRGAWIRADRSRTGRPGLTGAVPPIIRFFRRPTSTESTESPGPGSVDLQDPLPDPDAGPPERAAAAGGDADAVDEGPFALRSLWEEMKDVTLMGKRGEGWFVAQVIAVLLIFFPPVNLKGMLDAVGVLAVATGVVFTVSSVRGPWTGERGGPIVRGCGKHGTWKFSVVGKLRRTVVTRVLLGFGNSGTRNRARMSQRQAAVRGSQGVT